MAPQKSNSAKSKFFKNADNPQHGYPFCAIPQKTSLQTNRPLCMAPQFLLMILATESLRDVKRNR